MVPQIIYFFSTALGLGYAWANHGQEIKRQAKSTGFFTYLCFGLLLWWGGFWHIFDWPQALILLFWGTQVGYNLTQLGKEIKEKINFWHSIGYVAFYNVCLYFGGFWQWR